MSNIIEFKLKKPSDDFQRIDELFSVTMWLGTNDEYEIDMFSNEDYDNKEIIVVDNASTEDGTDEYLESLKDRGFKVFVQKERDPANEYAKALNLIAENDNDE